MANLDLIIQRNPLLVDQGAVAAAEILQVVSAISEANNSMTPRDHRVRNEDLAICKNKGDERTILFQVKYWSTCAPGGHRRSLLNPLEESPCEGCQVSPLSMRNQGRRTIIDFSVPLMTALLRAQGIPLDLHYQGLSFAHKVVQNLLLHHRCCLRHLS